MPDLTDTSAWREDPPVGFRFSPYADYRGYGVETLILSSQHVSFGGPVGQGQAPYSERWHALKEWLIARGLQAVGSHRAYIIVGEPPRRVGGDNARVDDQWLVGTEQALATVTAVRRPVVTSEPDAFECPSCGDQHPRFTFECPADGTPLYCGCGAGPVLTIHQDRGVNAYPQHLYFCTSCGTRCGDQDCEAWIAADSGLRYCDNHAESYTCTSCERTVQVPNGNALSDYLLETPHGTYCLGSCAAYVCQTCERWQDTTEYNEFDDVYECSRCRKARLATITEDIDSDLDELLREMATIPGREVIRKCGIEIEGGNGTFTGRELARRLYNAGISHSSDQLGYHPGNHGFAHVESDSTVDWELVTAPLNPAYPADVENLNITVKILRDMVRAGELKLDMRAGLHVHVTAARSGVPQAYNLSHVFSFLEDPLFRIGAARWPWHRACGPNDRCRSIPKHNRKTEFYATRGGHGDGRDHANHYYALSFVNYFESMLRRCQCGAVAQGFWDECTCDDQRLGKCTFEFRLFNTTSNPRKIGAYLALCQALVAKAFTMPDVKNPNDEFPALPFNGIPFKRMAPDAQVRLAEAWAPRLAYLFRELPFTDDERAALRYCVKHSEIAQGLTEGELEDIWTVEEEKEVVS